MRGHDFKPHSGTGVGQGALRTKKITQHKNYVQVGGMEQRFARLKGPGEKSPGATSRGQ